MKKTQSKEIILTAIIPLVLFVTCLVASQVILPENCLLYEYRITGLLCDGVDIENPQPCPVCRDETTAGAARILFGVGFGFLLLPLLVMFLSSKDRKRQIWLFE